CGRMLLLALAMLVSFSRPASSEVRLTLPYLDGASGNGSLLQMTNSGRGPAIAGGSSAGGVTFSWGQLGGVDPIYNQHAGVYGESDQQGVFGYSRVDTGTGVYGGSPGRDGMGFGVRGETVSGVGVQGIATGDFNGSAFDGDGVQGTQKRVR